MRYFFPEVTLWMSFAQYSEVKVYSFLVQYTCCDNSLRKSQIDKLEIQVINCGIPYGFCSVSTSIVA